MKKRFWYYFWLVYIWLVIAMIPAMIALWVLGIVENPALLIRAGIVLPFGLCYGLWQLRKEKNKEVMNAIKKC